MGKVTSGEWQRRDQALAKMTEDFYPQLIGASESFAGRPTRDARCTARRAQPCDSDALSALMMRS
eukprot:6484558-Prymnesium_polylepis.1